MRSSARTACEQCLGTGRGVRPRTTDAAPEFAPRHGAPGGIVHAGPLCAHRRGRKALRTGKQRRGGFGGMSVGDFSHVPHTSAALQPRAGNLGRGGVHGRKRHPRPVCTRRKRRRGCRGLCRQHGRLPGPHRPGGGGRPARHPAADRWSSWIARRTAGAATRRAAKGSTPSISRWTTSRGCALSASDGNRNC